MRDISTAAHRLLTIVNDLIELSRIEAGDIIDDSQPFNLISMADTLIEEHKPKAREKGLYLRRMIQEDVPPLLEGHPALLRNLLNKILGNAVKFTESGGVELSIAREFDDADRMHLHFAVSDTGWGFPPNT